VDRYRTLSDETRRAVPHRLDLRYGPSALECVDVFLPLSEGRGRPLHVFFHGGYWRAFDKADYSFVARPITQSGAVAVIANYGLMPAVSMAELLSHCRSAIRWAYGNAPRFGASPDQISVSGHSAGGHIASLLHLTSWNEYGLPIDTIKATVAVSGIYDLGPIIQSFLRSETGLTEEDVALFSPMTWASRGIAPTRSFDLCFGADETDELRRQSEMFAGVIRGHGVHVDLRAVPQRHHMSIVLDLGDAGTELGQLLLDRIFREHGERTK